MKNNFAEILSLEDTEFSNYQKRSKSTSSQISQSPMNSHISNKNSRNKQKTKRFLLEKHNEISKEEIPNTTEREREARNRPRGRMIEEESINMSMQSFQKSDNNISSIEERNHKTSPINIQQSHTPAYTELIKLQEKYKKLKEKYKESSNMITHWRNSYFKLLNDSIGFEECIKSLYEENRIHLEYITSLENKNHKLLTSMNYITTNFHNSLMKTFNLNDINEAAMPQNNNNVQTQNSIAKLNQAVLKNYNEVFNDYKMQLEILAEEKDNLSTNLSMCRHQQLQSIMKLEEMQTRLYVIEKARLDDLKYLQPGNSSSNKRSNNNLKF